MEIEGRAAARFGGIFRRPGRQRLVKHNNLKEGDFYDKKDHTYR